MARAKETEETLYNSQLLVLQILYKFRFGTNDLIARYRDVHRFGVNRTLLVLRDKGYIERKYDNKKKIQGESAVYHLSTKGIRYLKSRSELHPRILQAHYKNWLVSDEFIQRCLAVFKAYLILEAQYQGQYEVFTKSELAGFDHYPEQLPDLFLAAKDGSKDFMLDLFLQEPFFVIKKRIKYYHDHRNEDWAVEQDYPSVLLVCPDARTEAKALQYTESNLDDFDFLITTVKAFMSESKAVWTNPVEPENLNGL